MILSPRKPPILKEIKAMFPKLNPNKTLFAWGDILFNPGNMPVSPDMWEHEETHERQQKNYPIKAFSKLGKVACWWEQYLSDPKFRLSQEVEAYQAQFKMICKMILDEPIQQKLLDTLATHLSSDMYGNMISFEDAKKIISK